jgi:hypothetical protein
VVPRDFLTVRKSCGTKRFSHGEKILCWGWDWAHIIVPMQPNIPPHHKKILGSRGQISHPTTRQSCGLVVKYPTLPQENSNSTKSRLLKLVLIWYKLLCTILFLMKLLQYQPCLVFFMLEFTIKRVPGTTMCVVVEVHAHLHSSLAGVR